MTPVFRPRHLLPATAFFLAGCLSPTPPSTFYSLSAVAKPANQMPQARISVDLAEFPDALDRPQLLLRTGENTLRLAEFHRWAGSLRQDFLQTLTEDLIRLTGSEQVAPALQAQGFKPDTRISLSLLQLDGAPGQTAVLKARWTVKKPDSPDAQFYFFNQTEPAGDNHEGLVTAQSRLISRLAEAILVKIAQ